MTALFVIAATPDPWTGLPLADRRIARAWGGGPQEVLAVREWVRFMLEEIRRKEAEAEEAQAERRRRAAGRGGIPQEPPDREQPGDGEAPAGADD